MSTQTNEPGADKQAATEAAAQARKAERARMSAILSCEEAKGREALANHLALNTEMSVEDAKGVLAAAGPAAPAKAAANPFETAMEQTANPRVGSDTAAANAEADPVQRILAAQAAATGRKFAA